jgi:HEAT repeat protein
MRFVLPFFAAMALSAAKNTSEEMAVKRVYGHLLIHDKISAVAEAKQALEQFPDSKSLRASYIRALCESGHEMEAWKQWEKNPQPLPDRYLLETIAWGVLHKAEGSNQLPLRLNSLIGAALTRDAKAVPLLVDQLRGSNAMLRSIAVKLSSAYGDAVLRDEIARLLREEKVWYVRLEVIQAIGKLRMDGLKNELKEIIGNPKTLAEEKAAAIIALVSMYDAIERQELQSLARSDRAGLRQLASEVVCHLNQREDLDLIVPLLRDASPDVRISALNTLGLMRIQEVAGVPLIELIDSNLTDSSSSVAITAAWCAILSGSKIGQEKIEKWLDHDKIDYVRQASAALAATGRFGQKLALKKINALNDPYARANLALGLIGQRVQTQECCRILYEAFVNEQETLWMWDESFNPLFRSLAPSRVSHIEQIPHYPVVIDQMTRLEILSVLSILRFPQAQDAVKGFLQRRAWGITGAAAATLLQEGDEEDLTAVRELLNDPDEKVRVQAGLILAIVGGDPIAVQILQDAYPHVDREMKVHILEALAHIGDARSIPFLMEILKEPFQILRVVAASALIQCLYH